MRCFDRRTPVLALALHLAVATAGGALVIVFKDGSKELVADRFRIEGDRLIATLPSGLETSMPVAAVDLERTEAMSKVAKGSAIVVETTDQGAPPDPAPGRTLADLVRDRPAERPPVAPAADASRSLRRTPAGNVDFLTAPRRPVTPADRGERILAILRGQGLRDADLYQGTAADRVLIDVVTAGRADVFTALERCAAGLLALQAGFPEVEALEIVMATATRSRAGQFVLTTEDAQRLANGAITPAEHFVAKVLF